MSRHYSASNQPSLWGSWAVAASWEPTVASRGEFLPTQAAQSAKRASKAQKMLERLKCGPATTWDLMQIGGAGFSSRLHELREAGRRIDCERHEDYAVYTLVEGEK